MYLVDGAHDGELSGEVGSNLDESVSFMKGFFDQFVLLNVQIHDGLFQIANTAVDQFGRFAACSSREIITFNLTTDKNIVNRLM